MSRVSDLLSASLNPRATGLEGFGLQPLIDPNLMPLMKYFCMKG